MTNHDKPLVELFVRAAPSDKREKGACLIGQQWFMSMYCLVEQGLIDLRFTPMLLELPARNYLRLTAARHLPVAWIESGFIAGQNVGGQEICSTEELEKFMEELGSPNLNPSVDPLEVLRVEEVFENLYMNLMSYIRYNNSKGLLLTLKKMDEYFAQKAYPYLLDNYITYPDCQLMPKLQHLRVVGRAYKNFDIPSDLTYLWAYIKQMYNTKAFTCSCPSDRDILLHYCVKDPLPHNIRLNLLGPECLSEIPVVRQESRKFNGDMHN